jgi:hypothetical protein
MSGIEGAAESISKWPAVLTCSACGREHLYLPVDVVYSRSPYKYEP